MQRCTRTRTEGHLITLVWRSAMTLATFTIMWEGATAQTFIADGFDFPLGSRQLYTQLSDGDGWYDAQPFGHLYSRNGKYHLGEDWNLESGGDTDCGEPVYAAAAGIVVFAESGGTVWGNVIIIRHTFPNGEMVETLYGHVESILTGKNTQVARGRQIGSVGDGNGAVVFCHLHFEVRTPDCPDWGKPRSGYSATPRPHGWLGPSAYLAANRPGAIPRSPSGTLPAPSPAAIPSTPAPSYSGKAIDGQEVLRTLTPTLALIIAGVGFLGAGAALVCYSDSRN